MLLPDWLTQNLVSDGIYGALMLAGAFILGVLKKKQSSLVGPIVYGLVGAIGIGALILMLSVYGNLPPAKPKLTPGNAENTIRGWVEKFGFSTKRISRDNAFVSIEIAGATNRPISVNWLKTFPNYIILEADMSVSKEHQDRLNTLSDQNRAKLFDSVVAEMARYRIQSTVLIGPPGTVLAMNERVPTEGIDENSFMHAVDDIDLSASVARSVFIEVLDRTAPPNGPKR